MLEEVMSALKGKIATHMNKFGHLEYDSVKIFVSSSVLRELKIDCDAIFPLVGYIEDDRITLHGVEVIEMKKDGYMIMIDSKAV